MPLLIERKRYLVALMALAVNASFAYENYFVMIPTGPRPSEALTEGLLQACLERLGPERCALVVRAYCLGLSREEIARASGRPVATIKTWLRRTLLELRRYLAKDAGVVANSKPGQE
jgi:DNA-directed RNA polymerase specialized sigma24 family protein